MTRLICRIRAWLRRKRPGPPPDNCGAQESHAQARQHAFWASELLLDQLRDLELVADEIRHRREE